MTLPPAPAGGSTRPVVLYVINSFDRGGAEAGLVALVKGGLFAGCRLEIAALVRGTGGLERQLREHGNEPLILLERERMRLRDLPSLLRRLRRLTQRLRPNIVIGSLPQANLLARLSVWLDRDVTFISFEHNSHLAKRLYETGYRLTSRRVDALLADTRATMKAAVERLYRRAPERRTVVPLVSFDSPANRSRPAPRQGPFRLVNAARFTRPKNQMAIIEAVARLNAANADVELTLYGEGPERRACEELAARLGIAPRVHFAGFVGDWAKRPADLFVLASSHEGLCIVALEAMHAGIPVLAPLIGGLRDYASRDTVQALPCTAPRVIADAVAGLMSHEARLRTMAREAAEMVDRRFGPDAVRKRYAEVNQALIACSGRGGPRVPAAGGRVRWASPGGRPE